MAKECPNCGKLTNTTQTRLVKDSCGHTKCRMCLLHEEYGCKSCDSEKQFQQIGSFDYPVRRLSKPNKTEIENSESSNSNTSTKHENLLVNKLINYEFTPCDLSTEKEKPNFTVNTETVSYAIENDSVEIDDWSLKIDEESKSDETEVLALTKDNNPDNEDSGKEKALKNRRKFVDRSHISILPGSPERYKCDACGKIFRSKKGTCYHDSCVTGIRPYQCTLCNRSFVKRSHFEYHERTHTGYKPFKCTLCDKAFIQNNKLNRHMLSHSKLKPFTCNNCGNSYRKKDDLKYHMTIHSSTAPTPFQCKICGKTFRVSSNLKRHVLIHSNDRPHVCDQCNKGFKDKSLLKRHERIHEKERPFSCAHCSRFFLSKSELRRHMTTHSSEKPFSCRFCKTDFRRKDNLNRHIRHHHSEESVSCENTSSILSTETMHKNSLKQKSKKSKKSSTIASSNSKTLKKDSSDFTNSLNQINSRLDSMGNITPVIRTTGELSNAVPVINGPISIKKFVENTETRKKTFTYIEPIPLAEAVVINKRIEEKLYQQNTTNYFFRNYSTSSRSNLANSSNFHSKSDSEKLSSNQTDKNCVKLKTKDSNVNGVEFKISNLEKEKISSEQNLSQTFNRNSGDSQNATFCNEKVSNSRHENEQSNYVSTIKHIVHPESEIESSSDVKELQKTYSKHWRRRTAETLKPNSK
ncbi:zinc finger protein 2 homolog isoform X2 [Leptopilina heterotoma]|nr:zinc finger protein 2 homolog isoform X2 [Leptopilina heterotoma]